MIRRRIEQSEEQQMRIAIRRGAALALLGALVALGACGDDEPETSSSPETTEAAQVETTAPEPTDTPTTAAPTLPSPCTLLPKDAAEALLPGAVLQEGIESGQGDNISCTYAGDPSGPTAQVEVFVGSGAKKSLDIDKDALAHEFTQPEGVGDEAWLEADNIFFRVGETWVQLRVVTLDLSAEQIATNLTAAATTVATSLE